jgi:uncharacterized protein YndB with AHSA1/START domain
MTEMTLVKTIMLNASPEKVFAYLTKSDLLAEWFHGADSDLREGKAYALMSTARPGEKICWGEVLEMNAPERLVYSFSHSHLQDHLSRVTFALEPCAGGTKLTLTHEGLGDGPADALEMLANHDEGWDEHMAKLRKIFAD